VLLLLLLRLRLLPAARGKGGLGGRNIASRLEVADHTAPPPLPRRSGSSIRGARPATGWQ